MKLLQDLITRQAERRPDEAAVVMNAATHTYRELEEASNRLARLLKAAGCRQGDRVSLLVPKSYPAIESMVGVLKADCIYVPMDVASPVPRLARILEACESRCVLATSTAAGTIAGLRSCGAWPDSTRLGWLDSGAELGCGIEPAFRWEDLDAVPADRIPCRNTEMSTAHILFTSGSTGVPKGVQITHSNVIQFLSWAARYFGALPEDRISCHPPLHFDLSTFDVFGTLSAGAQLHLVPPEISLLPHKLADFIRRSELTQWFSVPSVLNYMAKFDAVKQNDFPSLKRVLWCGEVFPTPALVYWMRRLPHVTFTNLYGPTETTIASSYYRIPACPANLNAAIPIGQACDGEELLVLDEQLAPVPPGGTGDLYIGGVGLSPGYWRDPEKTRSVFLASPFRSEDGERIYKTGDLASLGGDGLIYLFGRADSQIKSRGYRIELGEIETAMNALECVRDCAVVAPATNGFEGTTICCAYVLALEHEAAPQFLRQELAKALPAYMLPAHWMCLDKLPLNGNGKADRRQLKEQFQAVLNRI